MLFITPREAPLRYYWCSIYTIRRCAGAEHSALSCTFDVQTASTSVLDSIHHPSIIILIFFFFFVELLSCVPNQKSSKENQ